MTPITKNLPKVDKKIKEKYPRFYKVWRLFIGSIGPETSTADVLFGIGLFVTIIVCLIKFITIKLFSIL